MDSEFKTFVNHYLDAWRTSNFNELSSFISKEYNGREILGGKIVDFGYDESIRGWEQGFQFVRDNNAKWELNKISTIPLRSNEIMVIISATIVTQEGSKSLANLFFQTFKKEDSNEWKLVRSYIEAGIPGENIERIQFS